MYLSSCTVAKSCPPLQPHGLQHVRLPCPSLSLEFAQTQVHWVNDAIQPSHPLVPLSRLKSFPPSGSFPVGWLFASGSQSIGASASASVLPMNIQDYFPWGLTGLIFLLSKGLSRVFSSLHSLKASILRCSDFFMIQLSHLYMTTGKTIALTIQTFVDKVMSLLFNTLFSFNTLSY